MTERVPAKATRALLLTLAIALALPVRAQPANSSDDGSWPMAAHDYAATRYSPLDQINTRNVQGLKLAFSFRTGTTRGAEAAPIVVGSTM